MIRLVAEPLVDIFTIAVQAGEADSPLDSGHMIDMHLGAPVPADVRLDSRERRVMQTHGSFNVLPAGMTGRWRMAGPVEALVLRLPTALLRDTADAMGLPASASALEPAVYLRDPQIERISWVLQAEQADGYASGRLFVDGLAQALAARLLALQTRARLPAPRGGLPAWRLRRVVDYVEAHLDGALSLPELAEVAGYSVSHFKALFKQAVGAPVHRYVLERRVARAQLRLREGTQSLAAIALEAGFAHQSHMARSVRRVLGVSPSQLAARATSAGPRRR